MSSLADFELMVRAHLEDEKVCIRPDDLRAAMESAFTTFRTSMDDDWLREAAVHLADRIDNANRRNKTYASFIDVPKPAVVLGEDEREPTKQLESHVRIDRSSTKIMDGYMEKMHSFRS